MLIISEDEEKKFSLSPIQSFINLIGRASGMPLAWLFYKALNRSRAIGLENLPKEGGALLASNHVSGVDTMLIPYFAYSKRPFITPAKEELFKVPVMGPILKFWGAFPVKRHSRDVESMKRIAVSARKYMVMIFPEGTRTKTGNLLKGRPGVGWIAYSAHPVVIPTLVINTDKFFWPGRPRPWFGVPYTVVFGEPVDLSRFYDLPDTKETSQAIVDEIMDKIGELKKKHSDIYLNPVLLPDGSPAGQLIDGVVK